MEPMTMPAIAPPFRVEESSGEAVTVTVSWRGRRGVGGRYAVRVGIAGMVGFGFFPVLSWRWRFRGWYRWRVWFCSPLGVSEASRRYSGVEPRSPLGTLNR